MDQPATLVQGRGTTREWVAASLRAEILDGRLQPGAPLRTEVVMERFGVSNSPLREAFAQLEAEGLVEVNRNRGAVVAPLTREGAIDLLDVDGLLWEGFVHRTLPGLSAGAIAQLNRADVEFQLSLRSGDLATAVLDTERFQSLLIAECPSVELLGTMRRARPRVQRVARMLVTLPVLDVVSVVHTEMLAAAGTPDMARPLRAIQLLRETLVASLETHPRFEGSRT